MKATIRSRSGVSQVTDMIVHLVARSVASASAVRSLTCSGVTGVSRSAGSAENSPADREPRSQPCVRLRGAPGGWAVDLLGIVDDRQIAYHLETLLIDLGYPPGGAEQAASTELKLNDTLRACAVSQRLVGGGL